MRSALRLLMLCAWLAPLPVPASAQTRWLDLWLTPDQQGQRLSDRGAHVEAAERYRDPMRRGVALFRAGDVAAAEVAFGQLDSPEAAYNRGNALLLGGRYDDAIQSYERALLGRPGWPEALDNRALARARKARLAPPEDDAGGTGGMLGADEIVFDERGAKGRGRETEEADQGGGAEDRAVWLRRVQTRPADFLRARFLHQLSQAGSEPEVSP